MVRGLQSAGVAATVKHFPGLGDGGPGHPPRARCRARVAATTSRPHEFAPFRAAIAAGARLAMSAHVAVPALTGDPTLPATLSRAVMGGMLRDDLGFGGRDRSATRSTCGRSRRGRPGGRTSSRRSAPGSTCCSCAADRRAQRRIEETLLAAAGARGCSSRTNWRPRRAAGRPSSLARGRAAPRPTSTSSARRSTGRCRASSRSGALTRLDERPTACRPPRSPGAPGHADPGGHARTRPT